MGKRIQHKHIARRVQDTKPGGSTTANGRVPQANKTSAIPTPDTTHYHSIARCHANMTHYEHRSATVPYEKLHVLETRYSNLWNGIDVQQYKGDFTEASYVEKFGELGKQLYGMMIMVRGAALPGDSSSTSQGSITAVHNTLSALLFNDQITPRDLQQLAGALSDADAYTRKGEDKRLIARQELNAYFQKFKIPMAFHITQLEGVEAVCVKRHYK